jgi:hypothetical protein
MGGGGGGGGSAIRKFYCTVLLPLPHPYNRGGREGLGLYKKLTTYTKEYRIQNTQRRTQNTEYRIQNTEYKIHKTTYGPLIDTALYVML